MRHKWRCHRLRLVFGLAGLRACELHGNLRQQQRLEALQQFKDGDADFLLATDLAARGLDIKARCVCVRVRAALYCDTCS